MADAKTSDINPWWLVAAVPIGLWAGSMIFSKMNECNCNGRARYRVETDQNGNRVVVVSDTSGAEIREGQANAPGYNPQGSSSAADPRNRQTVTPNNNDASFNV